MNCVFDFNDEVLSSGEDVETPPSSSGGGGQLLIHRTSLSVSMEREQVTGCYADPTRLMFTYSR